MDKDERLWGPGRASKFTRYTRAYLLSLARDGQIPAIALRRSGGRTTWRFRRSDLERWIKARTQGAA